MSGHSKWSTIKHKKAAADAKRGKVFTRLIKELTIAARLGGGDPTGNPRLRAAIAASKSANMPADNMKRAIQKGTGELPGVTYEEVAYEGYGPGGVAVLVETLTDNRMRTTPEMRHLFSKHNGNLGEPNSVAWMFEKKGRFVVPVTAADEDRLTEILLEAGGEDLTRIEDDFEISCPTDAFQAVMQALEQAEIVASEQELTFEPSNRIELSGTTAEQCIKLLDALEEHDDVQHVHDNLELQETPED